MSTVYARTAVNVAQPHIDRLYDYALSEEQALSARPGMRVIVPFGRGDRKTEGMIVSLESSTRLESVKTVLSFVDSEPVLDGELLKLALHMRARLGCTFYSVLHAMLPSGLWYRRETKYRLSSSYEEKCSSLSDEMQAIVDYLKENPDCTAQRILSAAPQSALDRLIKLGAVEKTENFLPAAAAKMRTVYALTDAGREYDILSPAASRAPARRAVIEFLTNNERADGREIAYYTGASASVLRSLEKAGLIERTEARVFRKPDTGLYIPENLALNDEQRAAAEGLRALADEEGAHTALLFGVTGSGKTEVYINLLHHVLSSGGKCIVLLPEIALTPQFTARFLYEFGSRVAVLHSALSLGERYDEWSRIKSGGVDVVVGTRSAVFAPVDNLKLIIIDEEHERTFSSDTDPRYRAHDAARYRALSHGATVVLGSATPSVDTAYLAKTGEYSLFTLSKRAGNACLASVIISDRREAYRRGFKGDIGPELAEKLMETLGRGEQAVFFINRRGTCRSVRCLSCGSVPTCPNCSSALSYHGYSGRLMCHLCSYSEPMPPVCPECGGTPMERIGSGTQSIEQELYDSFPGIRVLRMDSDTAQGRDAHETILSRFAAGEADVLVGTQMIAKGLDFPNVTLSAVIDADMSLYTGDFRACEQTFSLITQVIGRSGRAEKHGYAVIQTANPQNEVIRFASMQDYPAFFESEIAIRRSLRLPPCGVLAKMSFCAASDDAARDGAERMSALLSMYLEGAYKELEMTLLGPAEAQIHKINNQYFYDLYIKYSGGKRERELLSGALLKFRGDRENREIKVYYNINL